MGDLMMWMSSDRPLSGVGSLGGEGALGGAGPGAAATTISESGMVRGVTGATAEGFLNRRRSPLRSYSNSSRPCFCMNSRIRSSSTRSTPGAPESVSGEALGVFAILKFDKFPASCAQAPSTLRCYNHVVLNSNPAKPRYVDAGLDGDHHALLERRPFAATEPRHLVHFKAETVPCTMSEVASQAVPLENPPCRAINFLGLNAGPNRVFRRFHSFEDGAIHLPDLPGRPSQEDGTSHIARIGAEYSTLV